LAFIFYASKIFAVSAGPGSSAVQGTLIEVSCSDANNWIFLYKTTGDMQSMYHCTDGNPAHWYIGDDANHGFSDCNDKGCGTGTYDLAELTSNDTSPVNCHQSFSNVNTCEQFVSKTTYDITAPTTPTPNPTNTPTPTPTTAPTSSNSSGSTGDGLSDNKGNKVCSDTKPGSAPVLLSAIATGINQITLAWNKAASPVSYYLVTYGLSSGSQQFGNPNVGGADTTSYTISGLSGGITYYFKVRAGNGCTPGDFSNELSVTTTGGQITGPATGFAPGVLGATTNAVKPNVSPTPTPEKSGEVLGSETSRNNCFHLSFLTYLGIFLALVAFHYLVWLIKKRKKSPVTS